MHHTVSPTSPGPPCEGCCELYDGVFVGSPHRQASHHDAWTPDRIFRFNSSTLPPSVFINLFWLLPVAWTFVIHDGKYQFYGESVSGMAAQR